MMIYRKHLKRLVYFVSVVLVMASCTPQKNLRYFQQPKEEREEIFTYEYPDGESNFSPKYLLKKKDVLYIQIRSSIDAESNKLFSDNTSNYYTRDEGSIYLNSYVIDNNGEISIPVVGKVKVVGLTVEDARQLIEDEVAEWIVKPVVICKMVNYKVSILGDVNRPGTYTFYQDHVSVFDVVAAAGDLNYYGNRKEVKIVRKSAGEDIIITLDLREAELLQNPDYYVQPGDIIYVASNKTTKSLSYFSQPLSTITSSLSLVTTIVTLVFALKK